MNLYEDFEKETGFSLYMAVNGDLNEKVKYWKKFACWLEALVRNKEQANILLNEANRILMEENKILKAKLKGVE